ncbi:DUF1707 domain-containing protein [Goodfellowiella coeruleoviolacea]|uniref:TM2 domain-containing protein n=1 Tax=Goodfellowiella coeruleoviolacea TaxID=334858 RepID=A0AAE3GMB4_9PSEU|nr:DUF1707 domain-containing protein [Goodfellowiella coeruleoviolacea]MCP2170112.1 TM2 domain-containing protein [Goodfellowiella coeruleoviolacea]
MTGPADPDSLRIGTQEREDAIRALGDHFSAGRLDVHEYEHRVGQASGAQHRGELRALFTDLPAPHPPFLLPPPSAMPPPSAPPVYPQQSFPVGPQPVHVTVEQPLSDKYKLVAGLLQIFLPIGIGRFYTGHAGLAIGQLLVTLFTFGFGALWSIIDGIVLLAGGGTDSLGRRLRD